MSQVADDIFQQKPGEPLRIIMAGGGTGGHIFPAIAIAQALQRVRPGTEILFIGARGKMEMEKIPQAGYRIAGLDIAGFNRRALWKNFGLPWKLLKSFNQVRQIFRSFKPNAVVGVGGYSSFPVLRYAQSKGIPSFIHESNSFAGKSNILLGKKATAIFVATEGMEQFFPEKKLIVSGNPVRENITASEVTRETGIHFFGLNPALTTVLVIGGSLGANSINEAIAAHLADFSKQHLQLIWQTGSATASNFLAAATGYDNIWAGAFIREMENAYAAADIIISRSGAMSVTEICSVGKPAIFVPFPFAAEDHQTANARYLVDRQAALLVPDAEAGARLFATLCQLVEEPELQERIRQNIRKYAKPGADKFIAEQIIERIT